MIIRFLLWVGFIARRSDDSIVWPFHGPPKWVWKNWRTELVPYCRFWGVKPYVLRNKPGVIKWRINRLLPRRWGIGWGGFEFGDRGH